MKNVDAKNMGNEKTENMESGNQNNTSIRMTDVGMRREPWDKWISVRRRFSGKW